MKARVVVTTLLLVDDDRFVVDATSWALDHAGIRHLSADGLDAALGLLPAHPHISIVLLDRGVVKGDLATSLARIREVAPHVVIVGTSGGDCREEFLAAGADHYLAKPWSTAQLLEAILDEPPTRRGDTS